MRHARPPQMGPERLPCAGPDGKLGRYVAEASSDMLDAYRSYPPLVREHANQEIVTSRGGYGDRQLVELAQNGADSIGVRLHERPSGSGRAVTGGGRIVMRLTDTHFYCADDGESMDEMGVQALMGAHLSPKRGPNQIGRFGLGFKAMLGMSDRPEFFSRDGSLRFDRDEAERRIRAVLPADAEVDRFPTLRLPEPVDPHGFKKRDPVLRDLMEWANNIVRLPLKEGVRSRLLDQVRGFPGRFLLFVEHVRSLTLIDPENKSTWRLKPHGGGIHTLTDGTRETLWHVFSRRHVLSDAARSDSSSVSQARECVIRWAAPLGGPPEAGYFWAYFPTLTASLVSGIVNAPWKTNEDRQNLLPGAYNNELIDAAAGLIADNLCALSTSVDPAKHLDALPRREESGDSEHSKRLRTSLLSKLGKRGLVPDQGGVLKRVPDIRYPPRHLTAGRYRKALERWAAHQDRPRNWLHHRGMTRERWAKIVSVYEALPITASWRVRLFSEGVSMDAWLEALVNGPYKRWEEANQTLRQHLEKGRVRSGDDVRKIVDGPRQRLVEASMAAIQTAELVHAASPRRAPPRAMGKIVLMADVTLRKPDPDSIVLPDLDADASDSHLDSEVDGQLAADPPTRMALERLGITMASPESRFRDLAKVVLLGDRVRDAQWQTFWELSRQVTVDFAVDTVGRQRGRVHVRTLAQRSIWTGEPGRRRRSRVPVWTPIHSALLPGNIVDEDGGEDAAATVDIEYHQDDSFLLDRLDVVKEPREQVDLSVEPWYEAYKCKWRSDFREQASKDDRGKPRKQYLVFESESGSGPLEVLKHLSHAAAARYTKALLSLEPTYADWTMKHRTRMEYYGTLECESPTIDMIRADGWIPTADGPVPFSHALGPAPKSSAALHWLLQLPDAHRIREAFELAEPDPVVSGESDPVPLLDVWPGLRQYLRDDQKDISLRRCAHISVAGQDEPCVLHAGDVYVAEDVLAELVRLPEEVRGTLEYWELMCVSISLALDIPGGQLQAILERQTEEEIEKRRAEVRRQGSIAARLLKAVGEGNLRAGLGRTLNILEIERGSLDGEALAEAVIAIHHTDALRQFKSALQHLDPPKQWAGSSAAVSFVESLGFPREWAGQQGKRRNAYVEVPGPFALPPLHDYQRTIVANVRRFLRSGADPGAKRRGMISLPTGAGKTRVAVQALVEARREDGFGRARSDRGGSPREEGGVAWRLGEDRDAQAGQAGDVLWVADRDELCEQAVESWRQVWSSVGTSETLRVSRMWGSQRNPERLDGDLHVIVATIQTLRARLAADASPGHGRAQHRFLDNVGVIVIDEAHRSIAPTFTKVINELGLTRRQRSDEPFLIGLTATPYRGYDKDETQRLFNRYAGNRLDSGAFDSDNAEYVVGTLQDDQVLARVDHETIEGGKLELKPDEVAQTKKARWLPLSAELRLARDVGRTRRILAAYRRHVPPDWPTLIFATSVEHAGVLAALLSADDIRARAVSGHTETGVRRRIVEEFRNGEIQVLVNYAVFREGFDAPKTRAIVAARPVYSPNLYFQMIGRGMRGEKNGGNDRCLVLNVKDNILNFDRALAFTKLDWVWDQ